MNFQESTAYLYGLGNEILAMKLGLENITKLLDALGNPQRNYLKVQIAGTNGKGSTVAFLESICVNAGINVGATVSPHLISITERVRINGVEISREDFAKYSTKIRETSEKLVADGELETVLTFFEQVTAIALLAFAESKVELAILETGIGGRFDATTAANAEIAAITPIDYDHQQILGATLAEIAAEKAAIIRENMSVVVSEQKEEAVKVILDRCRKQNVVPKMNSCKCFDEKYGVMLFATERRSYYLNELGLNGEHQRQNACTALNLAEVLIENFKFEISNEAIETGLKNARHKGRLEWAETNNAKFLFDGAHNIGGAKALKNYLSVRKSPITLVFGAMRDKDLTDIAAILFPLAENLILTMPDNPRSMEVSELKKYAEKFVDESNIFLVPKVADAVDAAIQINSTYPSTMNSFVCVTGSLYLVGEAQRVLRENV